MKRRPNTRMLSGLLAGLVSFTALSQAGVRPRLVVGIVVDQLQSDYLDYLHDLLGADGFRRFMEQGRWYRDLDFGVPATDAASATAQLYTGAYPGYTGIPSSKVYDRTARRSVPVLMGPDGYSPQSLLLSTISDEIAVDGIGLGAIYSIAADPDMAVLMGGHAANNAVWIDPNTGRWTSSAYYREQPLPITTRNNRHGLPQRADTMQWKPLLALDRYPGLPHQKTIYPFRYTFPSRNRDTYRLLSVSPLGNREVTDLALEYLSTLQPGRRGQAIDMLNIGYTLAPYPGVKDSDPRLEMQDAYLRLDADLSRLLTAIDRLVGRENAVIFLMPGGRFDPATPEAGKYRIPGGEFSTRRAASLLNSYLSATYGNRQYVESVQGQYVYFDPKAVQAVMPRQEELYRQARDFLSRMSGVAAVYSLSDILDARTEEMQTVRRATDPRRCGELYVEIQPGWTLVDDDAYPPVKKNIRLSAVTAPGFILAPGVRPEIVTQPVRVVEIAPTVCRLLRIRSPNGARR